MWLFLFGLDAYVDIGSVFDAATGANAPAPHYPQLS